MMFGRQYSTRETCSGAAVLLCLTAVALGVFVRQSSFNPAVLVARNAGPSLTPGANLPSVVAELPPELKLFGASESFTPANLYDKIDGKAELYLSAGFVQLRCQRFALKDAPDQWLEWFVYEMGGQPQAFSVFSLQRRTEGQPLSLAEFAYQTKNALYFVSGSNYVEAIASSPDEPLMNATRALAGRFVAANPAAAGSLPGMDLLPTEDLLAGSQTLQSADAFGFDQFKNVFTAQYKLDAVDVLAFVTSSPNAGTAAALRDAYRSFLLANGGREVESPANEAAGKPIEIMGTFEIVFSEGTFTAGIHAAPAIVPAEQLARRLHERLAQKTR
jgi:hypothetical protein